MKYFFLFLFLSFSFSIQAQADASPIDWTDFAAKVGLGGVALVAVIFYVVKPNVEHSNRMQERLVASNELMSRNIASLSPTFNDNLIEAERRLSKLIDGHGDDMKEVKHQLREVLDILKKSA